MQYLSELTINLNEEFVWEDEYFTRDRLALVFFYVLCTIFKFNTVLSAAAPQGKLGIEPRTVAFRWLQAAG